MMRALWPWFLLAGCGGTAAHAPRPTAPPVASGPPAPGPPAPGPPGAPVDDVWRPAQSSTRIPAFSFRIGIPNGDGTTGMYLAVDDAGRYYNDAASNPRPTDARYQIHDDYSLRDIQNGRTWFYVRASDGELRDDAYAGRRGSTPAQDLSCHFTPRAELRCLHDGHTIVLSVHDGHLHGSFDGLPNTMGQTVEPDPTTDEQRRLVLFVYASFMIGADAESHDGDACCFSGR